MEKKKCHRLKSYGKFCLSDSDYDFGLKCVNNKTQSLCPKGNCLSIWGMGIASMSAKAQTEARRAINVAKMAIKGRSAGRKAQVLPLQDEKG